MREKLQNILENIKEELQIWSVIELLYKEKQETIVHKKAEDLKDVDAKIINELRKIGKLNSQRTEVINTMQIDKVNLSSLISLAEKEDEILANEFIQVQQQIKEISEKIHNLEKINKDLIQHGLTMTGKTIQIMFNVLNIHNDNYNNKGESEQSADLRLSSVIEEA